MNTAQEIRAGNDLSLDGWTKVYVAPEDGVDIAKKVQELTTTEEALTPTFLWVWCGITIVVTILDYIIPAKFTRATGGTKAAERGSLIGTFVGLFFFPPMGILIGAFAGALVGEIVANGKDFPQALGPAFGAFLGFIFSTFLKIVVCFIMMFYIVKFAI